MSNNRNQQIEPVDWVRLSFESQTHFNGYISASVIGRTISAVDRLARLLTGAYHSDSNEPLRPFKALTKEFQEQYELVLGQSEVGIYVLPLSIRHRDGVIPAVFQDVDESSHELTQLTSYFDQVIASAVSGSTEAFSELIPQHNTGLRIITAVRDVFPTNDEYAVKFNTPSGDQTILDSQRDGDKIISIQSKYQQGTEPDLTHKHLNIIAEIEAIDKIQEKFRAKTIDGELFEGSINHLDSLNISILPSRIEIDGVFTLDDAGVMKTVDDIETVSEVKMENISVPDFIANDQRLEADPPLTFNMSRVATDIYLIEGELGIILHADSEKDAKELLHVVLEDMWIEYALEENANLADDAKVLKRDLLKRIRSKCPSTVQPFART